MEEYVGRITLIFGLFGVKMKKTLRDTHLDCADKCEALGLQSWAVF